MKCFPVLVFLAILFAGACTNSLIEDDSSTKYDGLLPDLTASCGEDVTRTYVEQNKYQYWHAEDLISVFNGNDINSKYMFQGKTGDRSGTFSAVSDAEEQTNTLSNRYAVYPYQSDASITENGVISLTLPSMQKYAEKSFGKEVNTMIAITESIEDTFLSFKNVCGYLKLRLYGDDVTVTKVVVRGNYYERIAGTATATITYGGTPVVTMSENSTKSVTIDCGDGVKLGTTSETATEFWVVLPVTDFDEGITIEVTDKNGAVFEKSTSNNVEIVRNEIQPMAALEFTELIETPENNEIWYTSTNDEVITLVNKVDSYATIESNEYSDGKGIIKFNINVTSILDYAFQNSSTLYTITLPETVETIGDYTFDDCLELVDVNIPESVTTIGSCAFSGCNDLPAIKLGSNVSVIESSAFSYCTSFTEVTIPPGVDIGENAFKSCTKLTKVFCMAETPPKGGVNMFEGCHSDLKIYVPSGSEESYRTAAGWSTYASQIEGYNF